jgi:hypothetical protein
VPSGVDGLYERFADRVASLPLDRQLEKHHLIDDSFLLHRSGSLEIYYAPFDYVAPTAKVTLVGVTPGWVQAEQAFREARRAIAEGGEASAVLRRAKYAASFSGLLRTNLVSMLDEIGLAQALGISSTGSLFDHDGELLHPTSAIRYPVFVDGRNYTGSKPPLTSAPVLVDYLRGVLAPELEMVSETLVVPLGKAVESALRHLIAAGQLDEDICLFGLPHPSGANAHRVRQFNENRDRLAAEVAGWF